MEKGVSIVVCCYNSALRLPRTLLSLAEQEVNSIPWEVIVINNNSTDSTVKIAYSEWEKYKLNIPFRVINEPLPGLTNARRSGVNDAKYDYILFCDDDNWLDKEYLQNGYNFLYNNPECGAVGGWSTAVSSIEFPSWFEKHQFSFAVGRPYSTTCDITNDGQIWGAGMFARKKLLDIAFDPLYPFFMFG